MGLVSGIPFHVIRNTSFGDPVEIGENGFYLSLRRKKTEILRVE